VGQPSAADRVGKDRVFERFGPSRRGRPDLRDDAIAVGDENRFTPAKQAEWLRYAGAGGPRESGVSAVHARRDGAWAGRKVADLDWAGSDSTTAG